MSLVFDTKPVAVIKGKSADSTTNYTVPGVTTASTTPANAATQINKIFGIVGKAIAADENMTRTTVEEAIEQ